MPRSTKDLESDLKLPLSASRKLNAVLKPAFCALVLVILFTMSFVGTKLVYDRYEELCSSHHFDRTKLGSIEHFGRKQILKA